MQVNKKYTHSQNSAATLVVMGKKGSAGFWDKI